MKDIANYEGLYAVTSCGKVWSYRNKRFLTPRKSKKGYLTVLLCNKGAAKEFINIQSTGITRCCRGEYNQYGGYIWKYKDEERSC